MSARSTISVLALGMSRPDSTIVVETSTSYLLLPEADHDLLERVLAHLPVRDRDPRLGHQLGQPRRRPVDRLDPVVDVEDLARRAAARAGSRRRSAARRTAPTKVRIGCRSSGGVRIVVISRMPVSDISSVRGIGVADIVSTSTVGAQPLQVLLVLDAEALLLVDDDQAEVLEPDGLLQQPVRADDDVDGAVGDASPGCLGASASLGNRDSSADLDRELRHPLGERREVLLREQRRRHEHGHLLAVLHRLERRAHRDLGLAVADVAADHPVHRDRLLHVGLDLVDRGELVGRLDVGEGVLELALPRGVRAERVARRGHPRAVQPDQLGGDLLDRLARPALGLGPVGAAEPVQASATRRRRTW